MTITRPLPVSASGQPDPVDDVPIRVVADVAEERCGPDHQKDPASPPDAQRDQSHAAPGNRNS